MWRNAIGTHAPLFRGAPTIESSVCSVHASPVYSSAIEKLVVYAFLLCLLAGCSFTPSGPDLERLYRSARDARQQPPVILIPGILGTRLQDGVGNEIWPGSEWTLLTSRYPQLAMPLDAQTAVDRLTPAGLFESAGGRHYYSRILQVLESAGGYIAGEPGKAVTDTQPRFYILSYDWRQDAIKTVEQLDSLIDQIRIDHGQPELQPDILAHSMGGLIARYYARYGIVDLLEGNDFNVTFAGAQKIRRLILVGTPNLGSVESMHSLMVGANLGFRQTRPEVIMTMPAIYQLFPHALHEWLYTTEGKALERDQFDARIWERFEMGPWSPALRQRIYLQRGEADGRVYLARLQEHFREHLERARRFTWALTVPVPEGGVRPVIFGGDCYLTPARLIVEEVAGESTLRLWPHEISQRVSGIDYDALMMQPGDGTVTKASLLSRDVLDPAVNRHRYLHFSPASTFFICERHDVLTSNITFQDNLLHALLRVD